MKPTFPAREITLREFRSLARSTGSYAVISFILFLCGLTAWYALKQQATVFKAQQVIFYVLSGGIMVAGVLVSMKSLSEEKARGTLELLLTTPITETQLVAGKYLGAILFLLLLLALTTPITLAVLLFADGNWGQLMAGYIGAILIGGAAAAVSLFYSALTSSQFLAALSAGGNVIFFLLLGYFSPYIDPPMKQVLREFSFYVHYLNFEKGALVLRDIIFFFSVILFYLFLTRTVIESRRLR